MVVPSSKVKISQHQLTKKNQERCFKWLQHFHRFSNTCYEMVQYLGWFASNRTQNNPNEMNMMNLNKIISSATNSDQPDVLVCSLGHLSVVVIKTHLRDGRLS